MSSVIHSASSVQPESICITYTTQYREGGSKFARVARTMEAEKRLISPRVFCTAVESKREFLEAIARAGAGGKLGELHFIGHGGMYGPMFGTTKWPEQFSPHEWRSLELPFAEGAAAYFHTCRSARWFAPFFARTFRVDTYGNHHYTTFSRRPDRLVVDRRDDPDAPLYVFGSVGKKSHGLLRSVAKYSGIARPEKPKLFPPQDPEGDTSYDAVASLYADVFEDIRVRAREWEFINAKVPSGARVLDIGCGNGALLRALSPRVQRGVGVDASEAILERAREKAIPNLSFVPIRGPVLPFEDGSFDVVVSCLSFRYLDWDPILKEIRRVLQPSGKLIVVDMVAAPLLLRETPRAMIDVMRDLAGRVKRRRFHRALRKLVTHPDWKAMLRYNPMRAEHEYTWYLGSRFPKGNMRLLSVGTSARILGFDSGPIAESVLYPESFP